MKANETAREAERRQTLEQLGIDTRPRVFAGEVSGMFNRSELLRLPPEIGEEMGDPGTGALYFMAGVSAVGGGDAIAG